MKSSPGQLQTTHTLWLLPDFVNRPRSIQQRTKQRRALVLATMFCGILAPQCMADPTSHRIDTKINVDSRSLCTQRYNSATLVANAAPVAASVPTPKDNREAAREMVETIARIDRAANEIVAEVSRRKQELVCYQHAYYDMYGTSYRYLGEPESENVGPPLPPRKKWLDFEVEQLQTLTTMLNSEVSSFHLPNDEKAAKKDELGAQLQIAHDCMSAITDKVAALKTLSAGPAYDNKKIADAARQIPDQLDGLNTVRKRLVHLL